METLDLKKVWQIVNRLSYEQTKLSEELDIWVDLLGHNSNYSNMSFESFLIYYSFRFYRNQIIVFNKDKLAFEDFINDDSSFVPTALLYFDESQLNSWIVTEVEMQTAKQVLEKVAKKEDLKAQITRLENQLKLISEN